MKGFEMQIKYIKSIVSAGLIYGVTALPVSAQFIWDGGAAPDGNWSAGNWTGTAPVDSFDAAFQFAGSTNLLTTNDLTGGTATGVEFSSGAGMFNLSGNSLTLGGNITNNSSSLQTINLDMVLDETRTVLTFDGSDITINGNLNGTGGLTKGNNYGTLTLTGDNTFTGPVWIQRGALSVRSLNRVAGGSAHSSLGAPSTAGNGTISFGTGYRRGDLYYTGTGETTDRILKFNGLGGMLLAQNGTGHLEFTSDLARQNNWIYPLRLTGSTAGTGEISGSIGEGSAGITSVSKEGSGTWILSGINTYSGPTDLSAGTLQIDGDNRSATGEVAVADGAMLTGGGTIGGAVSLNGTLQPGGTLSLPGGLTATGNSKIYLNISSAESYDQLIVSSAVLNGQVIVELNSAYTPSAGDTFQLISGPISGSPQLDLPPLDRPLVWDSSRFTSHGELTIVNGAGPDVRYALWLEQNSALQGSDTLGSADPYEQGFDNLTRYAFGGAPSADSPPCPLEIMRDGDEMVIRFVGLRPGTADPVYRVCSNDNLVEGSWTNHVAATAALTESADQSGILQQDEYIRRQFAVSEPGFFTIEAVLGITEYSAPDQTLQLDTGTWTVDFPIPFSSSGGSLTVTGNGTLILSADNAYSGPTTVSGGTLLINGNSSAATGNIYVENGATLGGSGICGGDVYLAEGARLRADITLTAASFSFGGFSVQDIDGLNPDILPGTYVLISGTINPDNLINIGKENAERAGNRRLWFEVGAGELLIHVEIETDVTAYGAVADDGLDDAEAFHQALTNLVDLGGGTLRVPPGDYEFTSRQVIDLENCTIEIAGYGKGVSVLRCVSADGIWQFDNSTGESSLTVRELTMEPDTGGNAGTALSIGNPSLSTNSALCSLSLLHVDFQSADPFADYFERHVVASGLKNAVFENVFVMGVRGSDWDNEGWRLSESGFDLSNGDGARFKNCYSKNTRSGYALSDYKGPVIFDRCNGVQNLAGVRVTALASGSCTVDITGSHVNTFSNNITVVNADRVDITGLASYVQNEIPNPTLFTDIMIENCADVTVYGCAFNQPFAYNRVQIHLTGTTQGAVIQGNIFNGQYWNGTGSTRAVLQDPGVTDVTETLNQYPPTPIW
jgi:autotransporter-associated beta strand protein